MKKVMIMVLAAVITVGGFTSCGKKTSDEPKKNEVKTSIENEGKKPMGKVAVNLTGEITEMSEDGTKIKVGDQWILITDDTRFEDDPDNGVKAVSKDLKVGNMVVGYTKENEDGQLVAVAIYSNAPAKSSLPVGKPMGKVALNISGEITEISEDGTKIKINDQWIIITKETKFRDDPDNGSEAVSKDFKVGNYVQGFTLDDTNNEEVTAYSIYSNGTF